MLKTALLLAVLATAHSAAAHRGCGGHDMIKRNPGGPVIQRRTPTDEASAAQSTDPNTECAAYSYQPVLDIKANYPTIWQTATIQASDTDATSLFATINATLNSKLPNDLPHGTTTGNWTGVSYNASDPDCWWSWHQCTTPAASTGLPADIINVPEPMTWGLGFDDGPNCSHNALYDYLQEQNLKATMFYIGSNVFDWPLQGLRAMADGHQICVHTWSHQYMTAFTNEEAFAELYYARKAIKEVLGVTPLCWRPPYGDVDNRIRMIAQGLNLSTIVWSKDTDDWKVNISGVTEADVDANYQAVITGAQNGTYSTYGPIVLNHELNNYTMGEFMKYAPSIMSAFKHVVPIASALNESQPYAESNYTYPTFEQVISNQSATPASEITTSAGSSPTGAASGSSSGASSASSGTSAAKSGAMTRATVALAPIVAAIACVFAVPW
ncbi:Chitin deacetylase [Saitozyma sp. JCM 24511]|nr:Chitin deacetylase [Saitozyma sp. JCM 24511]